MDFSRYKNTVLEIYNIGWLDKDFEKGEVQNPFFLNKLTAILKRERVDLTRGIDFCPLCPREKGKIRVPYLGVDMLLGISEIWIPSVDKPRIFASPDLIIHYIGCHSYLPPQEFIKAVEEFDLNSNWSGEKAHNDYIKAKFG